MDKMPLAAVIFYSIPESIILFLFGIAVVGEHINIKKVLVAAFIAAFSMMSTRWFIPYFGVHSIIAILVLFILFWKLLGLEAWKAIVSSLLSLTVLILLDNFILQAILTLENTTLVEVMQDSYKRVIYTYPHLIAFGLITWVVYHKKWFLIKGGRVSKDKYIKEKMKVPLFLTAIILCQGIILVILNEYFGYINKESLTIKILSLTYFTLSIIVMKHIWSLKHEIDELIRNGSCFILTQAGFFIIIILSYKKLAENFLLVLIVILSLLYPLITLIMFYLYTRHESQKEIIKKIEEFNLNLRKQRHDFLNHLEVIYGLIDFNEIDEAKKYLELFEASVKINSLVDKVKNPYMSIIISSFAKKAESKGVRFELYGFNDFLKFPLSPIHTTTVMSNLLKNSLENCRINDCVYIETEIAHGYFYLKISNDGKPVEILHGENFSDWQEQIYQGNSSKGENRGAGMLIIKDILSQYDDCNLIVLNREKPSFMLKLKITEGTEYD